MTVGIPPDAQFFELRKFKGLNTKAQRTAIDDEEFSWLENLIPLGDGNLRAVPGPSPALYTTPGGRTIQNFVPFNISTNFFHIVFLDNGAADVVAVPSSTVTHLFPAGTFSGSVKTTATQFGNKYLLIIDPTKGYFIWDGTTTYFGQAGASPNTCSLAPVVTITNAGSSYTSAPGVTVTGGHGSGTSLQATIANGSVVLVNILNSGTGFQPGDTLTVNFSGGGGSGAAATVTLMPTGLTGTDIEVFQSRVWIMNGGTIQLSAPASVSDFAASDGAAAFTATDSVLRVSFVAFRQASGFLYPIADSSIEVINNVQTSSGTTTFNNNNVDPQVGTIWRDTTVVFGRAIMLANTSGAYGLYGGAAEKVSPQLDGVFQALTGGFTPSAALALIFNIKIYVLLLNITDPFGVQRPVMFGWDGQKWFALSQGNNNITQISTMIQNSAQQCWASDGTTLFQCFTTASNTLNKKFQSKLWPDKSFIFTKETQRLAVQANDNVAAGLSFTFTIDSNIGTFNVPFNSFLTLQFQNNIGGNLQFRNNSAGNLTFIASGNNILFPGVSWSGKILGLTFNSTSPDFTLIAINLMFIQTTAY